MTNNNNDLGLKEFIETLVNEGVEVNVNNFNGFSGVVTISGVSYTIHAMPFKSQDDAIGYMYQHEKKQSEVTENAVHKGSIREPERETPKP